MVYQPANPRKRCRANATRPLAKLSGPNEPLASFYLPVYCLSLDQANTGPNDCLLFDLPQPNQRVYDYKLVRFLQGKVLTSPKNCDYFCSKITTFFFPNLEVIWPIKYIKLIPFLSNLFSKFSSTFFAPTKTSSVTANPSPRLGQRQSLPKAATPAGIDPAFFPQTEPLPTPAAWPWAPKVQRHPSPTARERTAKAPFGSDSGKGGQS